MKVILVLGMLLLYLPSCGGGSAAPVPTIQELTEEIARRNQEELPRDYEDLKHKK